MFQILPCSAKVTWSPNSDQKCKFQGTKTERQKVSTSTHARQCTPRRNRSLTWKSLSLPSQTRSWNCQGRGRTELQQWGKSGLWQFLGALSWSSAWWGARERQSRARHCLTKGCGRTGLVFPLDFPTIMCTPCLPAFPDTAHRSNFSGRHQFCTAPVYHQKFIYKERGKEIVLPQTVEVSWVFLNDIVLP